MWLDITVLPGVRQMLKSPEELEKEQTDEANEARKPSRLKALADEVKAPLAWCDKCNSSARNRKRIAVGTLVATIRSLKKAAILPVWRNLNTRRKSDTCLYQNTVPWEKLSPRIPEMKLAPPATTASEV